MPISSIPHLVSHRAAEAPGAPALDEPGRQLTYAELDRVSNQIAHALVRRGVGRESLVGIALPRSIDFVVAALGVLKSGGAYLPLDPTYPRERLQVMAEDAEPRLILAAAALPFDTVDTLLLDGPEIAAEPATAPEVEVDPASLAYAIYTSGSSGAPKGVLVEHRNLSHLVDWHIHAFAVTSADRATLVASPSFDAAVWETWPYLASGACLMVPDDATRQSARAMRDWLLERGVTMSFVPTPLAEAMLDLDWPTSTPLRFLLTGADVLRRYPRAGLPFPLVNNYGPTECTVVTTSGLVPPAASHGSPPTIGAPIADVEVRVLDPNLQTVAAGQAGELFIGGAGVARGYLRRPWLTAERFVCAPDGARLYRTGDAVRLLPDGSLDFIGRFDDQVKIHGYRVELGEVTWVLEQHTAVEAGAVVAREDHAGGRVLVAYVVPRLATELTVAALREHMQQHLPEYMIPAAFVRLASLPLKASGKVDRAQLPEPSPDNLLGAEQAEEPAGGIVSQVAALVAELLGVNEVASEDNFFLMGGHSLFAAQLTARVRELFGVELPLRTVFDAPTVSGLSAAVDRLLVEAVESLSEAEAQRLLA